MQHAAFKKGKVGNTAEYLWTSALKHEGTELCSILQHVCVCVFLSRWVIDNAPLDMREYQRLLSVSDILPTHALPTAPQALREDDPSTIAFAVVFADAVNKNRQ